MDTRLSNRKVKVNSHFDWLTITIEGGSYELLPDLKPFNKVKILTRNAWYETREKLQCGAIYGESEKNGAIIEMSGGALQNLRDVGYTDANILEWFKEWRPSRLDYCINVVNLGKTRHIMRAWEHNAITFNDLREQKRPLYVDGGGYNLRGDTAYLGNRQGDFYIRVYDKSAEQREKTGVICNEHITRIEMQTRNEHSRSVWEACKIHGINKACVSKIWKKADVDLSWYRHAIKEALQGDTITFDSLGIKHDSDVIRWLNSTVMSAIINYSRENGNEEIRKFIENVKGALMI